MHRLLLAVALAAPGLAHAERSYGLGLLIQASQNADVEQAGAGLQGEIAFARAHHQYVLELGAAGIGVDDGGGLYTRAGGGVRLLARSTPVDGGSIDLLVEGIAGVAHVWSAGRHIVRPEVAAGLGWQVRWPSRFAVRFTTRVVYAPVLGDDRMDARRNVGFLGVFGAAW